MADYRRINSIGMVVEWDDEDESEVLVVPNSILQDVKRSLGIDIQFAGFDSDILIAINSSIMTLTQMGAVEEGVYITDSTLLWNDLMKDESLTGVKSYILISVRLLFDPPSTSFVIESMTKQQEQILWRLGVQVETLEESE